MSDTLPPVPDKATRSQRRVKPVSRKLDKFERLRSLTCFEDVNEMIETGWPLAEIAKYIQKTKKEYDDVEELSLIYILQSYRRSLPPATLVSRRLPHAFQKASQEVRDGLDVLSEMTKLYEIQMKRIEIDHALELKAQKLIPSMTQEVKEARSILESFQKLKMDLGLDERHLGTLTVGGASDEVVTRYGKSSVRRVLDDPQASRKVLSLAERFVQISQARDDYLEEDEEEGALLLDDDGSDDGMFEPCHEKPCNEPDTSDSGVDQ